MQRLRPTVYEMVAGPGQKPMSLDSHFKTFNTTPCNYLSFSNSSFTCKTPLSTSSHSFLFCPSLLSMLACPSCFLTYPCDMFSGLWRLRFPKHVPSPHRDTFPFLSLLPLFSPNQLHTTSSRKSSLYTVFCIWMLLGSSSFWPSYWFALAAQLLNKYFEVSF